MQTVHIGDAPDVVVIKHSHQGDDGQDGGDGVEPRVDGFHQELAAPPGPWQPVHDDGWRRGEERMCFLNQHQTVSILYSLSCDTLSSSTCSYPCSMLLCSSTAPPGDPLWPSHAKVCAQKMCVQDSRSTNYSCPNLEILPPNPTISRKECNISIP